MTEGQMIISDQVLIAAMTGIFSIIQMIFTGVMAYFMAKLNQKTSAVAVIAEETRGYTNSGLGVQLDISAALFRERADRTKEPGDIHQAEMAEQRADAHRAEKLRQEQVASIALARQAGAVAVPGALPTSSLKDMLLPTKNPVVASVAIPAPLTVNELASAEAEVARLRESRKQTAEAKAQTAESKVQTEEALKQTELKKEVQAQLVSIAKDVKEVKSD